MKNFFLLASYIQIILIAHIVINCPTIKSRTKKEFIPGLDWRALHYSSQHDHTAENTKKKWCIMLTNSLNNLICSFYSRTIAIELIPKEIGPRFACLIVGS